MMYERFTDRARESMRLANQEAQRLNHEYIGTEHMLLGILKSDMLGASVAQKVMHQLGATYDDVKSQVESIIQSDPDLITMGKLPQTPRAKKAVNHAMEEARKLGHNYIGTQHLLLGLMREGQLDNYSVAVQALDNLGVKHSAVTAAILETYNKPCDEGNTVTEPTCKTCRWYVDQDDTPPVGWCYRFPPIWVAPDMSNGVVMGENPEVQPTHFCGEHTPKDDA